MVAFSSGNHARGVAIAAKRLGIRAVIVMPSDAPAVKVEGTRGEGAEIIFYDRRTESREAIAAKLSEESGATVVPSFDDPRDRRRAGHRRPRDPRADGRAAIADHHSVRRRRAGERDRAGRPGRGDRHRRAGGLGRHEALARAGRDRAGRAGRARLPSATRSRRRACRRSPSASSKSAARRRCQSATPKPPRRSASPGASTGSRSSRAARSRSRRCSPARSSRRRIRSSWCRVEMWIRTLHARILAEAA